jgi:hypothetical protein
MTVAKASARARGLSLSRRKAAVPGGLLRVQNRGEVNWSAVGQTPVGRVARNCVDKSAPRLGADSSAHRAVSRRVRSSEYQLAWRLCSRSLSGSVPCTVWRSCASLS